MISNIAFFSYPLVTQGQSYLVTANDMLFYMNTNEKSNYVLVKANIRYSGPRPSQKDVGRALMHKTIEIFLRYLIAFS